MSTRRQISAGIPRQQAGLIRPPAMPIGPVWSARLPEPRSTDTYRTEPSAGYLRVFLRHRVAWIVGVLAGLGCAWMLQTVQIPMYQARASLEVQPVNENFLNFGEVSPTSTGGVLYRPDYDIQTQVKILQSRTLIERVVDKLRIRDQLLATSKLGPLKEIGSRFGLQALDNKPAVLDPIMIAAQNLKVRAQVNTRVVEIAYESSDAGQAAAFANALAAELIDYSLQARWSTTRYTAEWLTRQMNDLRVNLENSEQNLQEYARANGLLLTSEHSNLSENKLRHLQEELSRAQAERIIRQSKYELAANAVPESLPEVLDDSTLRDYRVKLTDLRRQRAELAASLTDMNPRVKKIDAEIESVEASLEKTRDDIVRRVRNEFESAERREKLLSADYEGQARLVSDQAATLAHYDLLKRGVEAMRRLHEGMLQRVNEASVISALRASNIRVIDNATVPERPVRPRLALNLALGLFTCCLCTLAFVMHRDRADRRINEPGDARSILNVPEMAVIPSDDSQRKHYHSTPPHRHTGSNLLLTSAERNGDFAESETFKDRPPEFTEAIRYALTSLLLTGENGSRPRTVVVSSPQMNEGKTTVVSSLAIALAEMDQRVLLIDADLLRPRLHQVFGMENEAGLGDILAGRMPPVTNKTRYPNLFLLTSGSPEGRRLIFTPVFPEVLHRLRREFKMVLIDAPPVLQAHDARVVGHHSDGMILVLRAGQTTKEAAIQARERLTDDGIPLLGTILNDWDAKHSARYGYDQRYQYPYAGSTSKT